MALAEVSDAHRTALVEGNNAFALDLYAKLKKQEGNLFFSPYSISTALANRSGSILFLGRLLNPLQ